MAKLRIHVKFHECNTKNWVPKMKKPIWTTQPSCEKLQEDAFVMDVAWLQRDSFHTLELSVQDTDFRNRQNHQIFKLHRCLFLKLWKQPKKNRWHLENVNYYYSIQRVFLGWDVRRSFERIFFKAVALDFQRFFVVAKLHRSFWMDPKEQQKLMLRLLSEAGKPWDV